MTARRMAALLCLVWLALVLIAGLRSWGWGWVAFFAFAAGEAWTKVWRPR